MKYYFILLLIIFNFTIIQANDNEDAPPESFKNTETQVHNTDDNDSMAPDSFNSNTKTNKKNKTYKKRNSAKSYYKKGEKYYNKANIKKAVYNYKKACKLRYSKACFIVGKIYKRDTRRRGKLLFKKDMAVSLEYHKKACNLKYSDSCLILYRYADRKNKEQEKELYLKKACKYGNKYSCRKIQSDKEREIRKQERKKEEAEKQIKLEKSCKAGRKSSCNRLGHKIFNIAYSAFNKNDYKTAETLFKKSCKIDYIKSCRYLGILYMETNDYKNADKYLKMACKTNNEIACNIYKIFKNKLKCDKQQLPNDCKSTAKAYQTGMYIPRNHKKALLYYRKACELNNADSCKEIAEYYRYTYKNNDIKKALIFYNKACKFNNKKSCDAVIILKLEIRCKEKDGLSCDKLGTFYDEGKYGLRKHSGIANRYFKQACEYGNKISCDK